MAVHAISSSIARVASVSILHELELPKGVLSVPTEIKLWVFALRTKIAQRPIARASQNGACLKAICVGAVYERERLMASATASAERVG